MDPTQALEEILENLRRGKSFYGFSEEECEDTLERLEDLGAWLRKGGFLPEQWQCQGKI